MNIKVGQWVRYENRFITVKEVDGEKIWWEEITGWHHIIEDKHLFKVANTPQELIEVGDLVEFDNCGNLETFKKHLSKVLVTKIYTKNSNGDYIKQWEVTK